MRKRLYTLRKGLTGEENLIITLFYDDSMTDNDMIELLESEEPND
jgi:hypothetical protein